jgi:hypothetical protein
MLGPERFCRLANQMHERHRLLSLLHSLASELVLVAFLLMTLL